MDCKEIVHFTSVDKKYSDEISLRASYTERKVKLENLNISINETWNFNGCEEVCFKNCNFTGSDFSININSCKKVFIYKCCFEDFRVPVFIQMKNIELAIEGCEFNNCIYKYGRGHSDWAKLGGVIHTDFCDTNARNDIRKTDFRDCGGRNSKNYYSSAIISNCLCEVHDCTFYNCWNYNCIDPYNPQRTLFLPDTEGRGNEIVNSASFASGIISYRDSAYVE